MSITYANQDDYTEAQREEVAFLTRKADNASWAAVVVDLIGRYGENQHGNMVKIEAHSDFRFEVRSLQHVRVYGFEVVYLNPIAKKILTED